MIVAIIVIVLIVFGFILFLGMVEGWAQGSEKIKRYYTPPSNYASKAVRDEYQKRVKRRLFVHIFSLLSSGRTEREIAIDKRTVEYGDDAGIPITGSETIEALKTSKEFLEANNLFLKLSNLVELGYDNKSIAKKLVPRAYLQGLAYSSADIDYMRSLLQKDT